MKLLDSLSCAPWVVASKTYGNSHATLIGLLVNWWITAQPESRWVLEGGPSFSTLPKGIGGGICDGLFGENDNVVGVLEVEGNRNKYTAEKIGKFFAAELDHYAALKFGILLLYSYSAEGKGKDRVLPPARNADAFEELANVSTQYPDKDIVAITLDKVYERQNKGIRSRNEYYFGTPSTIKGYLFKEGQEKEEKLLYQPK